MGSSRLAKILDQEMVEARGAAIASAVTDDSDLPIRSGADVFEEIGGRLLVRYMVFRQLGQFAGGSNSRHWVTPTPLSVEAVGPFLALPSIAEPRKYAMLINPSAVPQIQGPRWVRGGDGIEYLLPNGFPASALAVAWEIEVT